ncbi:hypothetical protein EDC04DRAFT_789942 [Pisolithus marmoratus]|nr:hypothetical protein EDC04DRAFT_789942 [Pisolithus marmoratus]
MEKPNTEQASMSGRWWQTRKWVVYITACYALHVILVINYVVLLVLYADGLAALVPIPTKIPNDVATASVTFILQTLGTGYSIFLVWITQRLALRRELLQKQTLTAIHDKASAWNGLGAGLNSLWDQSRVNGSTSGVFLVIVYLGGIFVLHITSGSLISAVAPNDCLVPDIFGGPCQVNLSLNINLTQVRLPRLLFGISRFIFLLTPSCNRSVWAYLIPSSY